MKNHTRFLTIFFSFFFIFCNILSFNLSTFAGSIKEEAPYVYFSYKLYPNYESKPIQFQNLATDAKVSYKSNDKSIATVTKKGYVKGVSVGITTIHVKIIQNSQTYEEDVYVQVYEPKVRVSNKPSTLIKNCSYPLSCITYGLKKSNIIATSSNPKIVKINKDMTVTGISEGTATITITDTISKKTYSFDSTVMSRTEYENIFLKKYSDRLEDYLKSSKNNQKDYYFGLQDINQDGYLDLIIEGSIYGSDLNLDYDIYSSLVVQTLMLSTDGNYLKVTSFIDGKELTQSTYYYKLEGTDFVDYYEDSQTPAYLNAEYEIIKMPYKVTSKNIKNLRKLLKLSK